MSFTFRDYCSTTWAIEFMWKQHQVFDSITTTLQSLSRLSRGLWTKIPRYIYHPNQLTDFFFEDINSFEVDPTGFSVDFSMPPPPSNFPFFCIDPLWMSTFFPKMLALRLSFSDLPPLSLGSSNDIPNNRAGLRIFFSGKFQWQL